MYRLAVNLTSQQQWDEFVGFYQYKQNGTGWVDFGTKTCYQMGVQLALHFDYAERLMPIISFEQWLELVGLKKNHGPVLQLRMLKNEFVVLIDGKVVKYTQNGSFVSTKYSSLIQQWKDNGKVTIPSIYSDELMEVELTSEATIKVRSLSKEDDKVTVYFLDGLL